MSNSNIGIFTAEDYIDNRGQLTYFPDWDLSKIKRTYIIEHLDTRVVRAWQGHQHENKWFIILNGCFKVLTVKPDDWTNPSHNLIPTEHFLTKTKVKVLHVPGGYTTGLQSTEPNSRLMVFSDFTTEESKNDDFRFNKNLWYNW